MEFDEIVVKESPGLCRCCLSEGCYKDLGTEYSWMDDTEIYADMLLECFDISISQHNDGPNGPNRLICEVCITRLRDACNFKKQVLASEKKFVDMIGRGAFKPKVVVYQNPVKAEVSVEPLQRNEDAEVEYLEEEIDFADDEVIKDSDTEQLTVSEDITVATLPVKGKRGRPRKNAVVKTTKKVKLAKTDDKPKTSKGVTKGENRPVMADEAVSKSSMTATKRHRLMKRNAIIILESSTVIPFKWHRQNYLCFYCHRAFKDTAPLKEHTKSAHNEPRVKPAVLYLRRDEKVKIDVSTIICLLCNTNIEDLNSLIDHLKTAHRKTFADNCENGVIPYKLQPDKFQCAICMTDFQYFIKLNQHMNKHYENYICELCGKSFLSQDRLRCHTNSHGFGFRCRHCPEVLDTLTQKINHELKAHDLRKLIKCLYCSETFDNYYTRKRHHSTAHNADMPPITCDVCGKTFQIMSKMRVHIKEVHLREKNFSCSMCDQKFFSKSHVQKHMIKHMGERIHQCEICKKSYARKQTLRDHMRIHNNDRRFVCPVCSQAFVQNNSLRLHIRVHHPDVNA